MGYFYNPEIILGEKFATNLHAKFCWKWKLTNQVKHYNKRYNACFLYFIHVESKKIIKQVCLLKQKNKLCACARKTLCLCAWKAWKSFLFQSRNLQWSINSPKKDTSYNCRYCLVFVPHQSAPYYERLVSSVKALDGLRLFIKQVKTENLVRSRTVDVPCFFLVLELARRCSHGSVVTENADPPWCTAMLSL